MTDPVRVALGFRAHSGWAAMVVAAGTFDAPRVVARRRIVICDPLMQGAKQPYHAAAELPFEDAQNLVRIALECSHALATEAIEAAMKELGARGYEVAACGVVLGSGKKLPELDRILASHALIHTAEGEMFRDVLVRAAQRCLLPVTGVREKGIDLSAVKHVAALGKLIGPPWTQDQKHATVAALTALGDLKKGLRGIAFQ